MKHSECSGSDSLRHGVGVVLYGGTGVEAANTGRKEVHPLTSTNASVMTPLLCCCRSLRGGNVAKVAATDRLSRARRYAGSHVPTRLLRAGGWTQERACKTGKRRKCIFDAEKELTIPDKTV